MFQLILPSVFLPFFFLFLSPSSLWPNISKSLFFSLPLSLTFPFVIYFPHLLNSCFVMCVCVCVSCVQLPRLLAGPCHGPC